MKTAGSWFSASVLTSRSTGSANISGRRSWRRTEWSVAGARNATYLKLEDDLSLDRHEDDVPDSDHAHPLPDRFRSASATASAAADSGMAGASGRHPARNRTEENAPVAAWPREFEIFYVIDLAASRASGAIVIELCSRTRKKNGEWSAYKGFKINSAQAGSLRDPADVDSLPRCSAAQEYYSYYYQYYSGGPAIRKRFRRPSP